MKNLQIIFLVAGILAVGILYSLPTVVVDNSSEDLPMEEDDSTDSGNSFENLHNTDLPSNLREEVGGLLGKLDSEENNEKFAIFADSVGQVYASSGKLDSAAYFYGLAAQKVPELEKLEKAGNAYYEAFGFAIDQEKMNNLAERTRSYLNQVLDKNPDRLDLSAKVAMTYVSSSNPMQGIAMLREILEKDPKNESALFNMGVLSMQSGQYKRAVDRFEDLVNYHPENIQGQFYLGVSYFESKQRNKAKKQFELVKGMSEDPQILSSVEAYLDRL